MNANHHIPDEDLIQQLKNGEELAFNELYNRYWHKLYYVAHRLLKDTDAAEEIVQEVFLVLWKKRVQLNIVCLQAYLAAMTRYAVYRYLSRMQLSRKKEQVVALKTAAAVEEIDLDNKILLEMIAGLSNQLPEKCRLVFQYNKLMDQSLADVARKLNISEKTAEAHLTKALRIIRANVGDVTVVMLMLEELSRRS